MSLSYDEHFQLTPLQAAAWRGRKDEARQLIAMGAEVNAANRTGDTPLHRIAFPYFHAHVDVELQVEIARLLLDARANVNARNNQKMTPLHMAALFGKAPLVKLFLSHGADANALSQAGQAPLHCAVMGGYLQVIELLLRSGADANIAAPWGGSPVVPRGSYTPLELILTSLEAPQPRNTSEDARFRSIAQLLRRHSESVAPGTANEVTTSNGASVEACAHPQEDVRGFPGFCI